MLHSRRFLFVFGPASAFVIASLIAVASRTSLQAGVVQTHHSPANHSSANKEGHMLELSSPSFQAGKPIPRQFTCEGNDTSPQLEWRNAPSGTKSFALIMHDPDAPRAGGFTHWVVYDIPASSNRIAENTPKQEQLPGGGVQGRNDFGKIGYGGPCPPSGTHRYFTRLYALDTELKLKPGATQKELEKAMQGHVVVQAELMGTYKKGSERAA